MIPKINSMTKVITNVTKHPKALIPPSIGALAVLSTHQVWPHPEKPSDVPHIEVQPDIPKIDFDTDFDPSEITPLGDLVADDNIVDVLGYVADKAKGALENIKDFIENIGH